MFRQVFDSTANIFEHLLESSKTKLTTSEIGKVIFVGNGIARVEGLPTIRSEELIRFPDDIYGICLQY